MLPKVKSSQEICRSSHVKRIAVLEERLVRQTGMLEELVVKVFFFVTHPPPDDKDHLMMDLFKRSK